MMKAFVYSFLLLLLIALTVWIDLPTLIASKGFFYTALCLLVAALVASFIILGKPLNTGTKDDGHKGK